MVKEKLKTKVGVTSTYLFEAFDKDGNLKWTEEVDNLVVTTGLNWLLDKTFKGSSYTAAHYVGLKGSGTVAASDTMSSHAGWSEVTGYSEATRETLTLGTVASGSVDNSASKAQFSINASVTVAGAFVTSDNTKSGTSGTLYGATDFSAARSLSNGDTLNITITLTVTAS